MRGYGWWFNTPQFSLSQFIYPAAIQTANYGTFFLTLSFVHNNSFKEKWEISPPLTF